jgi:uncharacterized protein
VTVKLAGNYREVISHNARDVLYVDNQSGYWFGVSRVYEPFVSAMRKGVDTRAIECPLPGWDALLAQLERDGQFDSSTFELPAFPRIALVIIEPSQKCNLGCHYCFEDVPIRGQRMSQDTADKIVQSMKSLNLADRVLVEFNGGETFLNFPVFRYLVEQLSNTGFPRGGQEFEFTVQSNGTAITPNIALFLKSHNINIGVSRDGPAYVHNRNRVFPSGRGSWNAIVKNLDVLREYGVGFGLLAVIERAEDVQEVYDALVGFEPMSIRLNLRRMNGRSTSHIADSELVGIAKEHYKVFRRSLELHRSGASTPRLANFCHMIENLVMYIPAYMCMRNPCGAGIDQVVFGYDGDIWPCQEFMSDDTFRITNGGSMDLDLQLKGHARVQALRARRLGDLLDCADCSWLHYCQGGCFATTYFAAGHDFAKARQAHTPHCAYYKYVFERLAWDLYYDWEAMLGYAFGVKAASGQMTANECGVPAGELG